MSFFRSFVFFRASQRLSGTSSLSNVQGHRMQIGTNLSKLSIPKTVTNGVCCKLNPRFYWTTDKIGMDNFKRQVEKVWVAC